MWHWKTLNYTKEVLPENRYYYNPIMIFISQTASRERTISHKIFTKGRFIVFGLIAGDKSVIL